MKFKKSFTIVYPQILTIYYLLFTKVSTQIKVQYLLYIHILIDKIVSIDTRMSIEDEEKSSDVVIK